MTDPRTVRTATCERRTLETQIWVEVNLDGTGEASISTGVPFLDHMLNALSKHSRVDINVNAQGDIEIDDHHTTEDVGLTLGRAVRGALGDRAGIARFGSAYAPMDESLARVVLDISGRPYTVYHASAMQEYAGRFQTYLVEHFFRSLAQEAGLSLHVELLYGSDPHHSLEAMFKALALALRVAVARTGEGVPSTKGALD